MNGSISENRWNNSSDNDNTKPVWNQTVDLSPMVNNNLFTVTEKDNTDTDKYNGSWSYFDGALKLSAGKLYLEHKTISYWANDEAELYAKFSGVNGDQTVEMQSVDNAPTYRMVTVPDGIWTKVQFLRYNPGHTTLWNCTVVTSIPDVSSNDNCFVLDGGKEDVTNYKTGKWTVYPTSHTHSYTPSWEWTDDYVNYTADAALTLSCGGENGCGRKVILKKFNNVPDSSDDEKYTFNASITFSDVPYTNTHYIFKRPTFEGENAVLTDNIGLNFYVDCHQFGKDSVGSLTFTQQKNSVRTETTKLTPAPDSTDTMYRAMFTVAAKEMGDTITATLTYGDNLTVSTEYTVADYLKGIYLNNYGEAEQNTKAKTAALQFLARSMLNYGSKAQTHFNYKTENLVDYGLDSYTPETTDGVKFSGNKVIGTTGLTYAGSSMLLEDTITYRVFFTAADKNSLPEVQFNNEQLTKGEKGGYV